MNAGYSLNVYNRTKASAQTLLDQGANWCSTPREVAEQSDVVFVIVGYPKDVEQVILDEDEGSRFRIRRCRHDNFQTCVGIAEEAMKRGVFSVDAPVSGGDIGARNATLSIMIGGNKQTVDDITPLFETMGKNIRYMGIEGSGQHTKMVNQILISTTMIGMVEGLLYAHKAGLDPLQVIEAVGGGAAGSWSINNYGPRICRGDLEPGFQVRHFIKDMEIALHEAKMMDLKLPGLELAHKLYVELKHMGYEHKGTHSLILALERMNAIHWTID